MSQPKIAFIGGGNMATAILGGLLATGTAPAQVIVSEPDAEKLNLLKSQYGIQTTQDNLTAAAFADVVVLAVKPQVMDAVLKEIAGVDWGDKLVLSIAAGITAETFEKALGKTVAVVRVMPNTPALVQKGASALFANTCVTEKQKANATAILEAVGIAIWLDNESQLDAVTALSGSGPAYFFLILEALESAACELGLDKTVAASLARSTMAGAAALAQQSNVDLAELRARVTSKGGTTAKGVEAMEQGDIRGILKNTLRCAWQRSVELSKI